MSDSKTLLVHGAATLLYTQGYKELAEALWDAFPLVSAQLDRATGLVESSVYGERYEPTLIYSTQDPKYGVNCGD